MESGRCQIMAHPDKRARGPVRRRRCPLPAGAEPACLHCATSAGGAVAVCGERQRLVAFGRSRGHFGLEGW